MAIVSQDLKDTFVDKWAKIPTDRCKVQAFHPYSTVTHRLMSV